MTLAARLDEFGKPAWIALTIVSFVVWWPLGVLTLGFLMGSRRMGCGAYGNGERWQRKMQRWQERVDRMQSRMQDHAERWWGPQPGAAGAGAGPRAPGSYAQGSRPFGSRPFGGGSGNHAFDEYRAETLRRLEDEQREFLEFLNRLRHAKDKAEFDQFMAERAHRPDTPPPVA